MPELSSFPSFDTTPLPCQQWTNSTNPRTILICLHGFCGASYDFSQFSETLIESVHDLKIVAFNLRGMGLDPVKNRRGSIDSMGDWIHDLQHLTSQLKNQYPNSMITWCGESLGAVIASHSYAQSHKEDNKCDALILLSPVVSITHKIPRFLLPFVQLIAKIFPHKLLKLQSLTGGQKVKVTQGAESHLNQSATNTWHIDRFSYKTLFSIASLINTMPAAASRLSCPTLIINGGNDFFTPVDSLDKWLLNIPKDCQHEHLLHPSAYHLILYDKNSDKIFKEVTNWLNQVIINFPIASHP